VRSIDGFLPCSNTVRHCLLRALKMSHCVRADAPLREHAAYSHTLIIFTRQSRLEREGNQSTFRFSRTLSGKNQCGYRIADEL